MRFLPLSLAAILVACNSTAATTPIHDIQGTGSSSPHEGVEVVVEGVVTGDFQARDDDATRDLGGFYIQGNPDSDDETSDGIFVFDGANPETDVEPGDLVRVIGTVNEYFGETQISAESVVVTGTGSMQPVPVTFPAAATTENADGELIADLERYEGMLVTFPQTLTVSQLRNLERFGEVLLNEGGREYAYTDLNAPDVAGYAAHRKLIAGRRIHLDDGRRGNDADSGGSAAEGSITFLPVSRLVGADWDGAADVIGSRSHCFAISGYSTSARGATIAIAMMSRLKVIELMGYCQSPAVNLSMGLLFVVGNDHVSKWVRGFLSKGISK